MSYLIDTNIAIHAGGGHQRVLAKLVEHSGAVVLSALTLVELQRGLYKRPEHGRVRLSQLETILKYVPVLSFDKEAAEAYGQIVAHCGWVKGRDFDRMIAAHAISTTSILVTVNTNDFRDIPGLKIENWLTG